MDLSSGGLGCQAELGGGHPLLQARRLAELVRQQHNASEQREREGKRKWEEDREEEQQQPALLPLQLLRAKQWPDTGEEGRRCGRSPEPAPPRSPAGSSSGSESGREEKRRRLDLLLNKKFEKVASCGGGLGGAETALLTATPPPSDRESSPPAEPLEAGAGRGQHRRKPAPPSPPALTLRPSSDLFPPAATSTPRSRPVSPALRTTQSGPEEKENKDAIKQQLLQVSVSVRPPRPTLTPSLQMQLAGSGLLSGLGASPPPELLKALQYNPLLYYSYYAQMVQALQAQQKLLELNTTPPSLPAHTQSGQQNINNNNNNNTSLKDILSPLRLGGLATPTKDSVQQQVCYV